MKRSVTADVSLCFKKTLLLTLPLGLKFLITGLDTNGDGDKSHDSVGLSDPQESDQTAMSTLGPDHSEYESLPESSETGKAVL